MGFSKTEKAPLWKMCSGRAVSSLFSTINYVTEYCCIVSVAIHKEQLQRTLVCSRYIHPYFLFLWASENVKWTINNGQSRYTGNIEHKTWNEDKQDKNTAQKSKTMNNTEPTK
jgi:hypothetical protein